MKRRLKVFFLSFYPPVPTMGGAMAYHRHFFQSDDFEIFIATDDKRVSQYDLPCRVLIFDQPHWLERATRSRFSLWAHSLKHLFAGCFIPKEVFQAARDFQPDLIFTIAGSWDWTAQMSEMLARKLRVPLVGSFNDWFDFGTIIHPSLKPLVEKKFRSYYQHCDLAFCTSEGMKEELGAHPHAHILYPMGALPKGNEREITPHAGPSAPFIVTFAGNLSDWYGVMLEELISLALEKNSPIEFKIYGANQSWSADFDHLARERDIYRGFLPFEKLSDEMAKADALILPMGFGDSSALIERTSFKTKFLDYLAFQKPILVWGPDYCSAVRVAREFDSAEICTDANPAKALAMLESLARSPERQKELIDHAAKMYEDRFHPAKIHAGFLNQMNEIVGEFKEHETHA
jgi:glycosyltransferase involved in cell wall biosynthesis